MIDNGYWELVERPKDSPHPHKPGDMYWVKAIAHIRNNATGEVRQYPTDEIIDHGALHPTVFNWEENNFSCDCNRGTFFCRAKGEDEPDGEGRCSDDRFSVNLQNPVDGEYYYKEFE